MKIQVEVKVIYEEDEVDEAIELCDELWSYEQPFEDDFGEDHTVEYGVTEVIKGSEHDKWSF